MDCRRVADAALGSKPARRGWHRIERRPSAPAPVLRHLLAVDVPIGSAEVLLRGGVDVAGRRSGWETVGDEICVPRAAVEADATAGPDHERVRPENIGEGAPGPGGYAANAATLAE